MLYSRFRSSYFRVARRHHDHCIRWVSSGPTFSERVVSVDSMAQAIEILKNMHNYPSHVWACDTEVIDIDIDEQGPVGNGKVICASVYGGPDVDFGYGRDKVIWIDNAGPAEGTLMAFQEWFENPRIKKTWHNYGFDRHVMYNEGIDCRGFAGDTMHMARLLDTGRDKLQGGKGYSLESLSELVSEKAVEGDSETAVKKISMISLFGVPKKKKDGEDSKIKVLPPLLSLQTSPETRDAWIEYSSKDALATWQLFTHLKESLQNRVWEVNGVALGNMMEFYDGYLRPFGELLTDMERNGIYIDTQHHLIAAESSARAERQRMEDIFMSWAALFCKDAKYLNTASTAQMQQFFFGEYDKESKKMVNPIKIFKVEKSKGEYDADCANLEKNNKYANYNTIDLKAQLKMRGLPVSGKKGDLMHRLLVSDIVGAKLVESATHSIQEFQSDPSRALDQNDPIVVEANAEATQLLCNNLSKVSKHRDISIETIGLSPTDFTPGGQPQVTAAILRKLSGKNVFGNDDEAVWGSAYEFFGRGEEAKKACRAIGALANIGQIDATITNFLVPLQALVDKSGRIHCSLNLNTETGRLSSRRPNLQNQPALEKDQYKIRDAFCAEEGNTLIVADYSQLELRILAHITNCKSMIDAFKSGGCFHSRTAVGMYPHIREAIEQGKVLLEWDSSKGPRPADIGLVKDVYASERRKAKTLNFSIAYGKTVHGLAADWGITTEEAEKTLNAWYSDRPEVKAWQEKTRAFAKNFGFVRTMMGRDRQLPDARVPRSPMHNHALRAAINTPIQGSAADIVMMAMLKIQKSEILRSLGYKLLLQIHDEVILEGPQESVKEALAEVRHCMENPFDGKGLDRLLVNLDVDAKTAPTWYQAK